MVIGEMIPVLSQNNDIIDKYSEFGIYLST